jgi:cytochrome P450 family 6
MRKYPPLPNTIRKCNETYIIPGTNLAIDKGTIIWIPIYTLQNDPKYFPNLECFKPERFSNDETSQKNKFVYLPFGEGPRMCIGT